MHYPQLSLKSVLDALGIDAACMPLIEEARLVDATTADFTPEAVYATIRSVGSVLNIPQQADQLAEDLEERINIISHKLKFIAEENKPHVVVLNDTEALTPPVTAYIRLLVHLAGGIFDGTDLPIAGSGPDILMVINGKPMPQLLATLPAMLAEPQWAATPAVTSNRIFIIHNGDYLRQPGARIADDAEILAEIIHPKHFIFGRDEDVWIKFDWQ